MHPTPLPLLPSTSSSFFHYLTSVRAFISFGFTPQCLEGPDLSPVTFHLSSRASHLHASNTAASTSSIRRNDPPVRNLSSLFCSRNHRSSTWSLFSLPSSVFFGGGGEEGRADEQQVRTDSRECYNYTECCAKEPPRMKNNLAGDATENQKIARQRNLPRRQHVRTLCRKSNSRLQRAGSGCRVPSPP